MATVVIEDSFSLNETDRKVGDTLNGTQTEVGGKTWITATLAEDNETVLFAGDSENGYVDTSYGNYPSMAIPFSFSEYSEYGDTAVLSVAMNFGGSNNSVTLAFGRATSNAGTNGTAYLSVNVNGSWGLKNAASTGVSGSLGALDNEAEYEIKLIFNESTNIVSAYFDGNALAEDVELNDVAGDTSAIFVHNQYSSEEFNSFSVEMIPEPDVFATLLGALSLSLVLGRRLNRN